MIAFINSIVAGAVVTLGINALRGGDGVKVALSCGVVTAVILAIVFLAYQRWRFRTVEPALRLANAAAP